MAKHYLSPQFSALSPEEQAENEYMDRTGIDPMTGEKLFDVDPYTEPVWKTQSENEYKDEDGY